MKRLAYPEDRHFGYGIVLLLYTLYVVVYALFYRQLGVGIAALAIFPVLAASWYLGVRGGVLTAIFSVLANVAVTVARDGSQAKVFDSPSDIIGTFMLLFLGVVIGSLGTVLRERKDAILKLEAYEEERKAHTDFLERLNSITSRALEADGLQSTVETLAEQIALLFQADDGFFTFWDAEKNIPVPIAAYGSMKDVYPQIQFQPGSQLPSAVALSRGQPLVIEDFKNSPHVDAHISMAFPSQSMLVIPLMAQNRKLGSMLLGYSQHRQFEKPMLERAEIVQEQVSLVLSKSLILEEERKQVKQLKALHDIALIAIDVDNEDELIHRVTGVIGQNVFTDNFGILLFNEQSGTLQAHPSYRFFSGQEHGVMEIPVETGVTGQVAMNGKPQRIGDVSQIQGYFNVDERTISELCVPIKFKERILGVINAESTKRDAFSEDDERLLVTLAGQIATSLEQIRKAQAERKWLDQLAHSNDLIYALAQITTHIEKAFSIDDIIRNLGTELSKIDLTCIMAVYDKEQGLFTVNYTSMEPGLLQTAENELGFPLITHTFSRDRLKLENILYPTALASLREEIRILLTPRRRRSAPDILHKIGIHAETEPLRLPLVFEETLLGILWIWGKGVTKADLPIMSIFAKQIGVSLERARLFQEVQSLALTDPLTGLQNRRSLFELGRVEFARAHRTNRPFCCMMLDLDHFKQVNDQHGHLIGDQVLQEFARRCKSSVREVDLIGRYGGEELMILLPETDRKTSMQVAERLRSAIASTPIKVFDREISVTVSIGVATKDENTTLLETLIARADQAMYIAKHRGRNRVAMSK